jgi:hypothetical protein
MTSLKNLSRGVLLVAAVMGCGCSWWRHRHDAPADAVATAGEATPSIAPAALPPEGEQMRAATTLATDFYEMRLRLGRTGLPDEGEMKAYRAFLCPTLVAAMDAARVRQRAHMAEHPDDKPPLIEGDLFSSLFEGVEVATPAGTEITGDSASVTMSMRFGEGDDAVRWKDALLLARDEGSWCIADVEYRGDWPFANKGKLSTTLAEPF